MTLKNWFKTHPDRKQKDMARRLAVSQEHLSYVANRHRRPSPDLALKIQEATGGDVTVLELLYPEQTADPGPVP